MVKPLNADSYQPRIMQKLSIVALLTFSLLLLSSPLYAYGSLNPIANQLNEKSKEAEVTETPASHNKASLNPVQIRLSRQQITLGEPVSFVLKVSNPDLVLAQDIKRIKLAPFTQDFVIDDITQADDYLRLKLYPLRVGNFTFKGQRVGRITIPDLTLQVLENEEVTVNWQPPKEQAHAQQLQAWLAQVTVENSAFKVRYLLPDTLPENAANRRLQVQLSEFSIQHLTAPVEDNVRGSEQAFIEEHDLVAVFTMPSALITQNISLSSPVVEVKNTTHKRWKFFTDPVTIEVKPLPNFLPLSAVVGKVQWQIDDLHGLYESGEINYWQWQLSAQNVTLDYLKGFAYELIRELPQEQIEFLSEELVAQQTFNEQGLVSRVKVTLPFKVKTSGWHSFNDLHIRFYSPQSGLVEQAQWQGQTLLALPTWFMWLLQWLMLIALFSFAFIALWGLKTHLIKYRFKRKLQQLSQQDLAERELCQAIWQLMQAWYQQQPRWSFNQSALKTRDWRTITQTANWITVNAEFSPKSLAQWQAWYHSFNPPSAALQDLIVVLNQQFYATDSHGADISDEDRNHEDKSNKRQAFKVHLALQQAMADWLNELD